MRIKGCIYLILLTASSCAWGSFTFSNIVATPSNTTATVSWTTSKNTEALVRWGKTTSYGYSSGWFDTNPLKTSHSYTITGLASSTKYYFQVAGRECTPGCQSEVDAPGSNFTTLGTVTITVTVSPATVTLVSSQTQQFTATVSGTTNQTVTWSATGGTITSAGLYTAPVVSTQTNYTVTATSVANTTSKGTATVTVKPASGISIVISSPASPPTVQEGLTQQFAATVTGSTNHGVNWSVTQGQGTINSSGLFTAGPSTCGGGIGAQTDIVKATAQADTTKSNSMNVTVSAPHYTALAWTASTGAPTSYDVKCSSTGSGGFYTIIASPTATSYSDSKVVSGHTYWYKARACNAKGCSADSSAVSSVIPTP